MNRGFVFRDHQERIIVVEFSEENTKYYGFELKEDSAKQCYGDIPYNIATLCYICHYKDDMSIFNVGSISYGNMDHIRDVVDDDDFMMCVIDYFDENESRLLQKVMQ